MTGPAKRCDNGRMGYFLESDFRTIAPGLIDNDADL